MLKSGSVLGFHSPWAPPSVANNGVGLADGELDNLRAPFPYSAHLGPCGRMSWYDFDKQETG